MIKCSRCGSTNVTQNADIDPNTMEIISVFDHSDCLDCDGECRLEGEREDGDPYRLDTFAAGIEAGIAYIKYGHLHSLHEGYGVLMEEVQELFDEIRKREPDLLQVYRESTQVAGVAIRIANLVSKMAQQKETNHEHRESTSTESNH